MKNVKIDKLVSCKSLNLPTKPLISFLAELWILFIFVLETEGVYIVI